MANDKSLELQIKIATEEALASVSSLKGELKMFAAEAGKLTGSDGSALAGMFDSAQDAAERAAASFKLFGGSSAELRQVQSELKKACIDLVREGVDPQSGEVKKLVEEYKKLEQAAADIDKANGSNVDSFGQLKNSIMSLAEVTAALKALDVIKDMGAFALKTADDFQTARNQFGTLLGDMQAGAGLFNEIKAFGDKTPFDLSTLTQATNVLISAKVPLVDLQDQMTKFGDLSQGNSQRYLSYINAFSQASAKGKADMQILNTYLNQGVPILDALARNFGVTTAEIVEMSSQGRISFEDFSQALDDLTAAGGQYFGGMELASQSLASMQEGLSEAANSLAASFGEMLMPAAVAVAEILTGITNAINENPILKGLFAAAIVAVTGYLAAMAVKAAIAFAAQMKLNFAIGALNPVVLASTIAVAALAAGYTIYSANAQTAARSAEDLALEQLRQGDAANAAADAVQRYTQALASLTDEQVRAEIARLNDLIPDIAPGSFRIITSEEDFENAAKLQALQEMLGQRRTGFIDSMTAASDEGKIRRINEQLAMARNYLNDPSLSGQERSQLEIIISRLNAELANLGSNGININRVAQQWKDAWADFYTGWQIEQSDDPFAMIEYERRQKLADAHANYIRTRNQQVLDQINEYYDAQRSEVIRQLGEREEATQRQISRSKIDDLEFELREALRNIDELERRRVIAAGDSAEEIERIREQYGQMRETVTIKYGVKIDKATLDEAREAVRNWQEELADDLLRAFMSIDAFSDRLAVILSDLSLQLTELSMSAAMSGFEEFGRALGKGMDAAESLEQALAAMARQILQQLPMMFLQAGLQLVANGQWPLGLGFIAAAGSSALISGYMQGKAGANAHGNAFDSGGVVPYASGGAFANKLVNAPTFFAHGGGFGVMGEAGPEAIMPLKRMPSGNLGVETNGGGANVVITINNYSGAEVRKEESADSNGNRQVDIIIGDMVNNHISSGKADRAMARYGIRAQGV